MESHTNSDGNILPPKTLAFSDFHPCLHTLAGLQAPFQSYEQHLKYPDCSCYLRCVEESVFSFESTPPPALEATPKLPLPTLSNCSWNFWTQRTVPSLLWFFFLSNQLTDSRHHPVHSWSQNLHCRCRQWSNWWANCSIKWFDRWLVVYRGFIHRLRWNRWSIGCYFFGPILLVQWHFLRVSWTW